MVIKEGKAVGSEEQENYLQDFVQISPSCWDHPDFHLPPLPYCAVLILFDNIHHLNSQHHFLIYYICYWFSVSPSFEGTYIFVSYKLWGDKYLCFVYSISEALNNSRCLNILLCKWNFLKFLHVYLKGTNWKLLKL